MTTVLGAGRHCFVEKPLTATVDDGRRLATLAAHSGLVVQVGHIFRFHPVTAAIRRALEGDRIGRLRFATATFAGFKRPRLDVGVTHTDAIHYFDLFAYLLKRPATSVCAVFRNYLGRGLDDMSITIVQYGETPVLVEANYFVPGSERRCTIVGERGAIVADYAAETAAVHASEHRRSISGWDAIEIGKQKLPVERDEPLAAEILAFMNACKHRSSVLASIEDGLHALSIAEAAERAARCGCVVAVADTTDDTHTTIPALEETLCVAAFQPAAETLALEVRGELLTERVAASGEPIVGEGERGRDVGRTVMHHPIDRRRGTRRSGWTAFPNAAHDDQVDAAS